MDRHGAKGLRRRHAMTHRARRAMFRRRVGLLMPSFIHTPYDGSKKPFTIGMEPLPALDWIEPDAHLARDLSEKDALFASRREIVWREDAASRPAQIETRDMLAAFLPARFPALYRPKGADAIEVAGRRVALGDEPPLLAASRLVQEDLCLMERGPNGWRLSAASLCFPSSWSLAEKFGRDMDAIHAYVPGFPGRMHDMVARIFDNLKVELPVQRLNWSIYGDGALHHGVEKTRPIEKFPEGEPILERAHLRVERQTLRKLPRTGAILFTIRIHVDPLRRLAEHPRRAELARGLRAQLLALTPEQLAYKGMVQARARMAEALDALAG
jgi:hypothetical protein